MATQKPRKTTPRSTVNRKKGIPKIESPIKEETSATQSPDPEAVAAYLAANDLNTPKDAEDLLAGKSDEVDTPGEEENEVRISLSSDPMFNDNKRAVIDRMFVSVKDTEIPISPEDQALYIKATLNNVPVVMSIEMENGIKMECRSLSVYEGDLVYDALNKFLSEYPEVNAALWEGIIQQYRIAMQLVSINGRKIDHLVYKYDPGKRAEHAEDLYRKSNEMLMDIQGPLFGVYVRGLNVFQSKLNRLQEAAFNKDFWSPVGTD